MTAGSYCKARRFAGAVSGPRRSIGRMARAVTGTLFAVVATALLLAGCGDSHAREVPSFTRRRSRSRSRLTEASSKIALDANKTTPYAWRFTHPIDATVVQFDHRKYETDSGSEGIVGAGGTETFTFYAVGSGKAKIDLAYKEINTGKVADAVTANVTVR